MIRKVRIVCVGKIKEKFIVDAINEFLKRLTPFCDLDIIELKDRGLEQEAKEFEKYIDTNTYLLGEEGKLLTSHEFSDVFKTLEGTLTLIIGGHDGILEELKSKCKMISLSKMTFTHEMARMFLIEQVYRSYMILNNRKYHR